METSWVKGVCTICKMASYFFVVIWPFRIIYRPNESYEMAAHSSRLCGLQAPFSFLHLDVGKRVKKWPISLHYCFHCSAAHVLYASLQIMHLCALDLDASHFWVVGHAQIPGLWKSLCSLCWDGVAEVLIQFCNTFWDKQPLVCFVDAACFYVFVFFYDLQAWTPWHVK